MKNKLIFTILFLLILISSTTFAQTWDGNNTTTGKAAVGTNIPFFPPVKVDVLNTDSYYGIKLISNFSYATYGVYSSLISSETSNTRYAIYADADNGTNDWGIYSKGKVGINVNDNNAPALIIRGSGTEYFRVEGSGFVYATEIKVQLPPFPDYVFEHTYDLLPLSQLESYIIANKRLPNVPSAEEIEKENIGLGELAVLQMEKIEELTLYMIELNKEVEKLKIEKENLKDRLENLEK